MLDPQVTSEPYALRLSTAAVPERDRLPIWREVFGKTIVRLDIEPEEKATFQADGVIRILPGVSFASVSATPFCARRTTELIQQDSNDSAILLTASAPLAVQQGSRNIVLAKGDAVFLKGAEPSRIESAEPAHYMNIAADAAGLAHLVSGFDDLSMTVVPADSDLLGLLLGYIGLLRAQPDMKPGLARRLAADHARDLIAAIAGSGLETVEAGVGAARLRAVKADIETHLGVPGLSLDQIAARHGISPRYIRRLFQAERTTFSDFVLGRRLDCAHQMLRRTAYAHQTIASIAYRVGFGDLSYFNRTFRGRFDATPSEVRHVACSPKVPPKP